MSTRRDLIKWVLYLGALSALPAVSSVADIPRDILEGLSAVPKVVADISGNAAQYRIESDEAFEKIMRDVWQAENGSARYVRVCQDVGIHPAHRWQDQDGEWHDEPESYVTFFQYRRA